MRCIKCGSEMKKTVKRRSSKKLRTWYFCVKCKGKSSH